MKEHQYQRLLVYAAVEVQQLRELMEVLGIDYAGQSLDWLEGRLSGMAIQLEVGEEGGLPNKDPG